MSSQAIETIEHNNSAVSADAVDSVSMTHEADPEFNEFGYKPVPVLAVSGLVLALLSSTAIFIWLVLPLCLVAAIISALSLVMIRRSQGAYGGTTVAISGIAFSLLFFGSGLGYQVWAYQTEVPEGYERVSFVKDISDKGVPEANGALAIHPDIAALDGKKVFIKGYIYQTGKTDNLGAFLLVKDNQSCCFGANPAISDRMGVIMNDGKTINYSAGKVAVAGTFRLNDKYDPEVQLNPIYILEADLYSTRVSDF